MLRGESNMNTKYFSSTEYNEFIKVARESMGNIVDRIPYSVAKSSFDFYNTLEGIDGVTKIATIDRAYETILPGFNKIAMKAVRANVVHDLKKEAASVPGVFNAIKNFVGNGISSAVKNNPGLQEIAKQTPSYLKNGKALKIGGTALTAKSTLDTLHTGAAKAAITGAPRANYLR